MAVATFDTLKFANTLKTAGVPAEQAEAQARAFAEVIRVNLGELASKDDAAAAQRHTDRRFEELREYVDQQITGLRADTDRQFKELREYIDRQVKELRAEIEQLGKSLRAEIEQLGKSLRAEIEQQGKVLRQELAFESERLRHKISEEIQGVNARLDTFQAKYTGDMALMRWMLAAVITIGGGILVRLFFLRGI